MKATFTMRCAAATARTGCGTSRWQCRAPREPRYKFISIPRRSACFVRVGRSRRRREPDEHGPENIGNSRGQRRTAVDQPHGGRHHPGDVFFGLQPRDGHGRIPPYTWRPSGWGRRRWASWRVWRIFSKRCGLEGDGPWPVVLAGYLFHSLARGDADDADGTVGDHVGIALARMDCGAFEQPGHRLEPPLEERA